MHHHTSHTHGYPAHPGGNQQSEEEGKTFIWTFFNRIRRLKERREKKKVIWLCRIEIPPLRLLLPPPPPTHTHTTCAPVFVIHKSRMSTSQVPVIRVFAPNSCSSNLHNPDDNQIPSNHKHSGRCNSGQISFMKSTTASRMHLDRPKCRPIRNFSRGRKDKLSPEAKTH